MRSLRRGLMARRQILPAACLAIALALAAGLGNSQDEGKPAPFAVFVGDYWDAYFDWRPSEGTAAGLHQYDNKLEDRSAAAVAQRIQTVKTLQKRLETLRAGRLTDNEAIDA